MKKLHNVLEEKIKKAERLPKSTPTDLSNLYTKDEIDSIISTLPEPGVFSGDMDDIDDGATYVKTENNFTDALASKLGGIESGAQVNINPDWTALSGDAEILNKPTIPVISDDAYDATGWNNNLDGASKNAIRDKFESLSSGGLTQPQIMARTLGC